MDMPLHVVQLQAYRPRFLSFEWVRCVLGLSPPKGTIVVNGFLVPEPWRGPLVEGQKVWVVCLTEECPVYRIAFSEAHCNWFYQDRGLVHLTKGAALIHAHALLAASEVRHDAR